MQLKNLTEFEQFRLLLKESISGEVRTRFAPSPTGPLHIGGVRTALYNYLFAKKNNGVFYIRIEDTDQGRFVEGAEAYILKSLDWCGIHHDEGPDIGGPYGPYKQSERYDIYPKYAKQLVDDGKAYYCFDTPEEIDEMKSKLIQQGVASPQYDYTTRLKMKNSLALSPEEVQKLMAAKVPYVIRVKFPENETIVVNDIIRGKVEANTDTLDDKVLFKSDGLPTYHLANIVDDHLMKTTHVIRGEEWLPSAPLHVFLYKAFGWEAPQFAHLALLLNPGGAGKLSKRTGDELGFPVFPMDWKNPKTGQEFMGYKEKGYIPEAFVNFLAFLGWNPGTEQEIMSMDELIQSFSLERCGKAGAKFNIEKAKWYNGQYMKQISDEEVTKLLIPILKERGINLPDRTVAKMVQMNKGKANFISDIYEASLYLFKPPTVYDEKTVSKKWNDKCPEMVAGMKDMISTINMEWTSENIQKAFEKYVTENGLNFGDMQQILRLVLTGMGFDPNLFDVMEIIGKESCIERMTNYKIKAKKKFAPMVIPPLEG